MRNRTYASLGLSALGVFAFSVSACFDTSGLSGDDTSGNGRPPDGSDAGANVAEASTGDAASANGDGGATDGGADRAIDVAGGQNFGCAVFASHAVWCWGTNQYGQVGQPPTSDVLPPTQVPGISDAVAVRAGTSFACVLKTDGTVACWGSNNEGQLGHDPASDGICAASLPCNPTPTTVVKAQFVTSLAASYSNVCTVNTSGVVACWGDDALGQLGNVGGGSTFTPTVVTSSRVAGGMVSNGTTVTCFSAPTTGQVYCLGSNANNALGHAPGSDGDVDSGFGYDENPNAEPVSSPTGTPIGGFSDFCYGSLHGCGIVAGSVTCWGRFGGPNGVYVENEATHVVDGTAGATQVACGAFHSCILQGPEGDVLCWGNNWDEAVGTGLQDGGTYGAVQSPTPVGIRATLVRGGYGQTFAIDADGDVWRWGGGTAPTPQKVVGLP